MFYFRLKSHINYEISEIINYISKNLTQRIFSKNFNTIAQNKNVNYEVCFISLCLPLCLSLFAYFGYSGMLSNCI